MLGKQSVLARGKRSLHFAPVPYIRYYTCVNIAKWFCSVKLLFALFYLANLPANQNAELFIFTFKWSVFRRNEWDKFLDKLNVRQNENPPYTEQTDAEQTFLRSDWLEN